MSSTQANYPRSPLADALLNSSLPLTSATQSSAPNAQLAHVDVVTAPPPQPSAGPLGMPEPNLAFPPGPSKSSNLRPRSSDATGNLQPVPSVTATASVSSTSPATFPRGARPLSEIIRPERYISPETEALDRWFEDLQEYERNLEAMAAASMDPPFKEELQHVDQWFRYLTEAERTATVYSLLQHSSPVQLRFFINVLQQMCKRDPIGSLLSPAHPEKVDMQAQLAGAMAKAELEANQKMRSILPYRVAAQTNRSNANPIDRHSFALGEADEHRLFGGGLSSNNDFLSTRPSSFGMLDNNDAHYMARGRLKPQSRNSMFNNASRPRSVIEGDLSSIFGSGWSFSGSGGRKTGGMVGVNDPQRPTAGRPKSADISNWSFGEAGNTMNASASPSPWGNLSPTMSTFSEHARTIERPSSASEIDHLAVFNGNWHSSSNGSGNAGRNVILSEDTKSFPRRRGGAGTGRSGVPGTVPETDERPVSANIVLSMYEDQPLPQKSTSTNSLRVFGQRNTINAPGTATHTVPSTSRPGSRAGSPVPSASNSANLFQASRYWENGRTQRQAPSQAPSRPATSGHYGQFLNPNDAVVDGDADYLSDHSDTSNLSASAPHNQQRYQNRKKPTGGYNQRPAGNATKEKKHSDTIDMQLLEDIPAWLRSLRLHKYNSIFENSKWQDMIRLSDEELTAKGVAALGARRKMLKVFEQVKLHCEANNIPY